MHNEKTDAELVSLYLNDEDPSALQTLISRYLKPVYNFVYHFVGNVHDAEDITQEVFVKVWKNLKKYRLEQSFKTWIFTIAKNTSIDWLRKVRHIAFSEFDSDGKENFIENTTADEEPLAEELAILDEDRKTVSRAMEKLGTADQIILVLRYSEDLTFKEIGEILKKPLDTVKSQHRRALTKLRTILKNNGSQY